MAGPAVLIIDDDIGDRKLIKRLVCRCERDAQISEACSIRDMVAIEETKFDAIFLDNRLPGVNGVLHIAALRERWPAAAIILVTGQGDEELAKSAILQGATDYVPKNALNESATRRILKTGISTAQSKWRLEEQRRDLTMFSEVLLHDLKAPIRSAANICEQVLEDLEAGDMAEVRDGIRLLGKASRQMMATIQSLSDHIRLDREETFEAFCPRDLIDRALTAVDGQITDSQASIRIEIDPDMDSVHCIGPQISQVLQNLTANAIKYAGDVVPEILLRVRNLPDGMALFEVLDNGMGVPQEHCDRIFEPFKRLPGRPGIDGSGLGLATCRKIIGKHHGRIWCEPQEPRGSLFCFQIPMWASERRA